jgi:predicted Zn-dependent protease
LRDTARAEKAIEAALAVATGGAGSDARALRAVRLIQVQVLLAGGDAQRAAAALRAVPDDGSRPLRLARVQVALADSAGDGSAEALRRSAEDLQTWVATHPNDAMAWETLAQAWAKAGRPLRAVRAEAESRVAIGDLTGAADRLRAGQRLAREPGVKPDEFIEVSVIDARLREIEAQRRQLAAEMRGNGSGRDGSRP